MCVCSGVAIHLRCQEDLTTYSATNERENRTAKRNEHSLAQRIKKLYNNGLALIARLRGFRLRSPRYIALIGSDLDWYSGKLILNAIHN